MSHERDSRPAGRAIYLLGVLLLLFVLVPVLHALRSGVPADSAERFRRASILDLGVYLVLVVAAVNVAQTARRGRVALLLIGPPLVARVVEAVDVTVPQWVPVAMAVYVGVALLYVVWLGLKRLFTRSRVTVDTIATAICAYILMGLAWMYLYHAAEAVSPQAFGRTVPESQELFYFSFVTLTTLGYGDITPKIATVRSLAIVEAILGQMYVAVVLARLVGMYFSDADNDRV